MLPIDKMDPILECTGSDGKLKIKLITISISMEINQIILTLMNGMDLLWFN